MAHHVDRYPRLGLPVVISESWYKSRRAFHFKETRTPSFYNGSPYQRRALARVGSSWARGFDCWLATARRVSCPNAWSTLRSRVPRFCTRFLLRSGAPAEEQAFKEKALEAAGNAKLVPNEELEGLNAKMHVSRGGQLTPYGDPHGVLAETKAGLDQIVRERAYLLWEHGGRPDGCADEFWHQAQYQRFCERAYALWEREGSPGGKADEHWFRTRAFEES